MDGFRDKLLEPEVWILSFCKSIHFQKVLRQDKENNLVELHTLIAFCQKWYLQLIMKAGDRAGPVAITHRIWWLAVCIRHTALIIKQTWFQVAFFFPHERQEGSIKRRISFYGFIILELNLAFIWQYYTWLMWPPWNAGYFKSLGMPALGPTIASSFLLFHFLQTLLDLFKNNQGSWAPSLKEVRLGQKATEQRVAIIIKKKIPLTARRNRPFLIIQRSEGLPTSDAAQVRHWYVFCVLLYPFWKRVLYKAQPGPTCGDTSHWGLFGWKRSEESPGKLIALRKWGDVWRLCPLTPAPLNSSCPVDALQLLPDVTKCTKRLPLRSPHR